MASGHPAHPLASQRKVRRGNAAGVSRRAFLRGGMYRAVALAAATQAGILGVMFWPTRVGAFGSVIKVGRVEDFPIGSVARVREGRFYLSRLPDGFIALYWTCPHLGCTVPWRPEEDRFHCPCHSSIYARTGQNVAGPAPRPMDFMPVDIRDGEVYVDTGTIRRRAKHLPEHVTPA